MSKKLFYPALTLILAAGAAFFVSRLDFEKEQPKNLPPAQSYKSEPLKLPRTNESPLPAEVNLNIPFTSQAPHKNWELPYKEFCEEASVLMAHHYLQGKDIVSPDYADAEMLKIKAFEEQRFGYYEDTTVEETAVILREYFQLNKIEVVPDPRVEDIKKALAEGKAVIVPAAGRLLPNPYFRSPGPLYHMLVIKGYTKDGKFITNDPGTRRGADFLYEPEDLMRAIHDWNGGAVLEGQKVMIIVG